MRKRALRFEKETGVEVEIVQLGSNDLVRRIGLVLEDDALDSVDGGAPVRPSI